MPNVAFADVTTLRVGGPIGRLTDAASPAELIAAIPAPGDPAAILLGAGSNTVPPDAGAAHVIRPRWADVTVHADDDGAILVGVGAGAVWAELAERAVAEGWSGFEALVGIPGSVGAAPVQNLGAYGPEVCELVASVTVWDRSAGVVRRLGPEDLRFDYRTSALKTVRPQRAARPRPAAAANGPGSDAGPDALAGWVPARGPASDAGPAASAGWVPARGPMTRLGKSGTLTPPAPAGRVPTRAPASDAGPAVPASPSPPAPLFPSFPELVVLSVTFRTRRSALSAPVAYPELAALLGVNLGDRTRPEEVADAVLALRRAKGMLLDPADRDTWSVGSYFTNPVIAAERAVALPSDAPRFGAGRDSAGNRLVKVSAAWLIAHAGIACGWGLNARATTSTKHVLALTNRGGASAGDIRELGAVIVRRVEAAFGIALVSEAIVID
ncbi:MAG: FAD-binding protein [Bifidobacteriaceae bacterium]|nr:FAD-binding protein [Bifidobacteriaceae bacterium]